jgi:hypothetical protein
MERHGPSQAVKPPPHQPLAVAPHWTIGERQQGCQPPAGPCTTSTNAVGKVSPLQRRKFTPEGAGLRPPAARSTLAALIAVHFPNNGPICPYAGGYQLNLNDLRYTKCFYRKIHRENDSGPQRDSERRKCI